MPRYPIEKYNIVVHQHPTYGGVETIAFSTYAGKVVYGKAICRVEDEYDEEFGKKVAIARCAAKIAQKRYARANRMYREASERLAEANRYHRNMSKYLTDAAREAHETEYDVKELLGEID